jgi:hypothetical protein
MYVRKFLKPSMNTFESRPVTNKKEDGSDDKKD